MFKRHDCEENPEDCQRVHGRRRRMWGKTDSAILGGILGGVAGLPLSYYFQPADVKLKYTLATYTEAIFSDLGANLNSEYGVNIWTGIFVCAVLGAIILSLLTSSR